ncbi:MAG: Na(+)-translocating NADH-quinone reductase subunit C [Planctomycetota bacterium]
MSKDSFGYVVTVAAALCVACSIVVSTAAVGLSGLQAANKLLDKNKNVLMAAGLATPGMSGDDINATFDEKVTKLIIDRETGDVVNPDEVEAITADYDQRAAEKKPELTVDIPAEAGYLIGSEPKYVTAYVISPEAGELPQLVLPIRGKGLWSTLYGFLALKVDFGQLDPSERFVVNGITYYEHAETPGLGGEVDNPNWKAQWPDLKAFDSEWTPKIAVSKSVADPDYHVDAMAGATITSDGVENMVQFWLGDYGFGKFLKGLEPDVIQTAAN